MRKLLVSFFLISAMSTAFIGCSPSARKSDTINIWHWMTDRQEAFKSLAEKYYHQTGIKVNFELYAPSDAYSQKIIAAAQARVLPDIYGILKEKEIFASFINSGFVADLTGDFQSDESAWERSLFEKAMDVNRFESGNIYDVQPGIYGVPIDVMNIQMLYNRKILQRAGINNVPSTFDEFIEAAQALHRIGVNGLVSGWGELWLVNAFALNYAFNIMGEEKIMATFRGEISYTDDDWISVFNVFKLLSDNNALAEGIVTKDNKSAELDFALERAAFAFNGSWCVNVYHGMNPELDYGVMLPPAINSDLPMRIWGAAGSSFVVNETSRNKDQAIAFLRWLTEKDQQIYLSEETRNLPSNRYALSSISEILSAFASAMDYTTHPSIWEYNEDPLVVESFNREIQSIIIGEKTPLEAAQEVQRIKNRQLQREKQRKR